MCAKQSTSVIASIALAALALSAAPAGAALGDVLGMVPYAGVMPQGLAYDGYNL